MANAYITLKTSDETTLVKRFRVVAEGYNDGGLAKTSSVNKTVGGGLDVSMGAIYTDFNPIIRVRYTEADSNYGSLANLQTFFSYNNPNATPSHILKYIDHHGDTHNVAFVGEFKKSTLGCMVDGSDAWYYVQCTFIKV